MKLYKVSYGLLLVLMLLATAAGSWLLRDFKASTDTILHDALQRERLFDDWRHAIDTDALRTSLLLASEDPA